MFDFVRRIHETAARLRWRSEGCPLPPPNAVKQGTIIRYANEVGIRVFVETGTYEGRTLRAVRQYFESLYSKGVLSARRLKNLLKKDGLGKSISSDI